MSADQIYDERSLLLQIADGNEDAFTLLFNRYHNLLGQFIFRITKSTDSAEELTLDIFLKIWQARETLAEVIDFKAYLFRVARNHALNAVRTLIREKTRQGAWVSVNIQDESVLVSPEFEEKEAYLSLIDQAIEQLPAQQKKAWKLSRQNRLSYEQIAGEMKLSKTTVKYYIQLAVLSISKFVRERNSSILPLILLWQHLRKN